MEARIEHEIKLDYVQSDGSTQRQHYNVLSKRLKYTHESLIPPDVPYIVYDILEHFWKLFKRSGITYQDIYYYQEVVGFKLSLDDIDIIMRLNSFAINLIYDMDKKNQSKK